MQAKRFRVKNFRNISDSDWIPLERVTAFVGRNESGKTSLLKALHKFNPGSPEPYNPQREFPRDRFTSSFVPAARDGVEWPVCTVEFELTPGFMDEIAQLLPEGEPSPEQVTATRFYSGKLELNYEPAIPSATIEPSGATNAMREFASGARRLDFSAPETNGGAKELRAGLIDWANDWINRLEQFDDLRGDEGSDLLHRLIGDADSHANPDTAEIVESLQDSIRPICDEACKSPWTSAINELVESNLPVFIYFENYGVLESAIWLPRFVEDLGRDPTLPQIRTVHAMFKHAGLDPDQISSLGQHPTTQMRQQGEAPTPEQVVEDQTRMEERAILLNSASIDISAKFSDWWSQRRHKIRYHADGEYFRIWVADDLRPDIEIELESRSKGFQWFFSFYLVFLVESDAGHKDAILLLDEPGLHLHPTAQQELISFFEELANANQVCYTTHSPFLIDGERLHRVRAVTEDDTGLSKVSSETWPQDRETIFPLQAAAGYAMIRGLFAHRKNVIVEGMSDFYYLHALSHQCVGKGKNSLPEDIYITPCGGTKYMGTMASLFLGHDVRPLVLLDGDEAGRARRSALLERLYSDHGGVVMMLDDFMGRPGAEVEIEDLLGADIVVGGLNLITDRQLSVESLECHAGSLPTRIEKAAQQQGVNLPKSWKAMVARRLVAKWAEDSVVLPDCVLDLAASLFDEFTERLADVKP